MIRNSTLKNVLVSAAMRRQIPSLPDDSTLGSAIKSLLKFKVSGLLIHDASGVPVGVVSKTDIVSAFYAGLPVDIMVSEIMMGPPLFCHQDDSLESALEKMRDRRVYRLYVIDRDGDDVLGVLAYPDIVAFLYVYCRGCEQSAVNKRKNFPDDESVLRFRVKDVMTPNVVSYLEPDSLAQIMEGMSQNRFSAVLITDSNGVPKGVVSKTDLMLAYNHGVSTDEPASSIISCSEVRSCDEEQFIEDAIREMVYSELHRLFVHVSDNRNITGVLSLSDVSRMRSGSCHACVGARITLG